LAKVIRLPAKPFISIGSNSDTTTHGVEDIPAEYVATNNCKLHQKKMNENKLTSANNQEVGGSILPIDRFKFGTNTTIDTIDILITTNLPELHTIIALTSLRLCDFWKPLSHLQKYTGNPNLSIRFVSQYGKP
jgi:hypothetical protein